MEPLAGWCVAVTAERRADEQAQLLALQGAAVVIAPLVAAEPCDDDELRRRTEALLVHRPDIVVASTAVGMRRWLALAWSWGSGEALRGALRDAVVVARGTKASAALLTEDIGVDWRSTQETATDVGDHLLARGVDGRRVAVQLDGTLDGALADRLADGGADVVTLPVYRTSAAPSGAGARRLAAALDTGSVDAVTFTSPASVDAFARVVPRVRADEVTIACVGPVTAAAAEARGITPNAVPARSRLGPMVRSLASAMRERARTADVVGHALALQGRHLSVDGVRTDLTPRERAVLETLLDASGAVVSKGQLATRAWSEVVDEHAVEVAVNRLRRKLGDASPGLETTNRRGYRLVLTTADGRW